MMVKLPDTIRFIERDWLAANHVMFRDSDAATLVDTGYGKFNDVTLEKVGEVLSEWGDLPLERIINTHIHSDHIGGNAALQRAHPGCSITIPLDEQPALVNWDAPEQMLSYADQEAERFAWDAVIAAGETVSLGGEAWEAIATPGHDMGSLVLYSPKLRVLISADALWENGFGVVFPELEGDSAFADVAATLDVIEHLAPRTVIPGHGPVFTDAARALDGARRRLDGFARNPAKHALYAAKVLLKYKLLEWQQIALADLLAWAQATPYFGMLHARHFADQAEGEWLHSLVADLVRSGAALRQGEWLHNA